MGIHLSSLEIAHPLSSSELRTQHQILLKEKIALIIDYFDFLKNVKIKVVIHISYFLGFSDPTFVLRMNMEIDVHILDDNHPILLLLILLQPCINGPADSCCR